jgi:hypothetical protein
LDFKAGLDVYSGPFFVPVSDAGIVFLDTDFFSLLNVALARFNEKMSFIFTGLLSHNAFLDEKSFLKV